MSRPRSGREKPYKIGFLGTMAIVTALIIFMWSTTFKTENQMVFVSAVIMLSVGVAFASILTNLQWSPFDFRDFAMSVLWTGVSAGAIYMVNRQVTFKIDTGGFNLQLFSVLQGVGEECFFRLFLTAFDRGPG